MTTMLHLPYGPGIGPAPFTTARKESFFTDLLLARQDCPSAGPFLSSTATRGRSTEAAKAASAKFAGLLDRTNYTTKNPAPIPYPIPRRHPYGPARLGILSDTGMHNHTPRGARPRGFREGA